MHVGSGNALTVVTGEPKADRMEVAATDARIEQIAGLPIAVIDDTSASSAGSDVAR